MDDLNDLEKLIRKLRTRDPKVAITLNPQQSAIAILRGKLAAPVYVTELRVAPYKHARQFIKENKALFGQIDEAKALVNKQAVTNRQGMTHVVFQQKHGNAVVLGGTLSMHYSADGTVYLIKSNLATTIDIPKKPQIAADRGIEIAIQHAGAGASIYPKTKPILVVVDAKTLHQEEKPQRYYLCWQMRIVPPKDGRIPDSIYLIDAITGEVLLRYSALQTRGTGHYSGGGALNSEAVGVPFLGGTFRLRDTLTSRAWHVGRGHRRPAIHTYDDANANSKDLRNYSEDANDDWNSGSVAPANRFDDQRAEVDVHRYLGYVLSYYWLKHERNSWNGAGRDVRSHAHNGYRPGDYMPNNAFCDPYTQELYFGDGDGATRDFYTALDTVGHEFTHAILAGFEVLETYAGETGAVNEAIADLFACFIVLDGHATDDPWPWHHGRQYRLDGTVGRNMIDPSRDTDGVVKYDATNNATKAASCQNGFYPDHYSIRYDPPLPWDKHNDFGGVHYNCPIITHAVYLMINGGTHRLSGITVTGIGIEPVEKMLYEVISTGLLNATSDFADLQLAFIEACQTVYPDNLDFLDTVKTAFRAVGIPPDSPATWLSLLLLDDTCTLASVTWLSLLLLDNTRAT